MKPKRWVVKAGSNIVCSGGPILVRAWMRQVAALRREHHIEVIWVTSGAIASAAERTGIKRNKRSLPEKQALSALGQPIIMDIYNLSLATVGLMGSQVLLTYGDLADNKRCRNLVGTLNTLLKWKSVPVLNENDAVATEEIKFGDNDSLSAKVAKACDADRLIILTDVEGLYDSNPLENKKARLVSEVEKISHRLLKGLSQAGGSSVGTGGMYSKINAASIASKKGIETWIVRGDIPQILLKVAQDEKVGTRVGVRGRRSKAKS